MYLDTASISHLSLDMNQLYFILCSAVFCRFYHSFSYCNESFLAHYFWLLGSLYNAILLLYACAQSGTRWIQLCHARTHGHVVSQAHTQSC